MKEFKGYNLSLISDFEIKVFKERAEDIDLIIPIQKRTINLLIDNMPDIITSRIQYNNVSSIVIRICKDLSNNIGTIHFLGDEGIHSTVSNVEIDYSKVNLKVLFKDHCVDFIINYSNYPLEYEKI
jgi:hypothetical protein